MQPTPSDHSHPAVHKAIGSKHNSGYVSRIDQMHCLVFHKKGSAMIYMWSVYALISSSDQNTSAASSWFGGDLKPWATSTTPTLKAGGKNRSRGTSQKNTTPECRKRLDTKDKLQNISNTIIVISWSSDPLIMSSSGNWESCRFYGTKYLSVRTIETRQPKSRIRSYVLNPNTKNQNK